MNRDEQDIFWSTYEKLSDKKKLEYLDDRFGELMSDMMRDYDFEEEMKRIDFDESNVRWT